LGGEYYKPVKKPVIAPDDVVAQYAERVFGFPRTDIPRAVARRHFLIAIEDKVPEVLETLYHDVFPLCSSHWSYMEQWEQEMGLLYVDKALEYYDAGGLPTAYGNALVSWLKHWNFTEDWLMDAATGTLQNWRNVKDVPGFPYLGDRTLDRLEWHLQMYDRTPNGSLRFDLTSFRYYPQSWDPFVETRKQFKDRFMERLEKHLDAYLDKVDSIAIAQGALPTPEKRNLEHFAWTVLYQALGLSYQQIADRYAEGGDLDKESVRDAVRKTADFIGIRLRPPKRGAPRKS
jgi:hypothetical protein